MTEDKQTKLGGSSSQFWGDERTGQPRPPRAKRKAPKKKVRAADAVRVVTPHDPASLAAIWPHVRPVTGDVRVSGVGLETELGELWAHSRGQLSDLRESALTLTWPSLVALRFSSGDAIVLPSIEVAIAYTARIGGTVAALLPLAALRLHAEWMIDHPPDVYVLPSPYQGSTSGWFVWSPDRGRGRLRFLRPILVPQDLRGLRPHVSASNRTHPTTPPARGPQEAALFRGKRRSKMGEVADMLLDGTLCQNCGGLVDDEDDREKGNPPTGVPRSCADCRARPALAPSACQPQPAQTSKTRPS